MRSLRRACVDRQGKVWGDTERTLDDALLSGFKKEGFDWSEDVSVEIPANEMVMYKLHVRDFPWTAGGRNKGTLVL